MLGHEGQGVNCLVVSPLLFANWSFPFSIGGLTDFVVVAAGSLEWVVLGMIGVTV